MDSDEFTLWTVGEKLKVRQMKRTKTQMHHTIYFSINQVHDSTEFSFVRVDQAQKQMRLTEEETHLDIDHHHVILIKLLLFSTREGTITDTLTVTFNFA